MSGGLVRHDIAVGNAIYGSASLMTLRLPEQWSIAPGVGRPEVAAAHDRAGQKWIAVGRAWYVLYHVELGWAMELLVDSGSLPRRRPPREAAPFEVHGHAATVRRWQRQRGVFHRKTITFVAVRFDCEETERRLTLELSGHCPPEGFEQVLASIPEWVCH